MEILPAVSAAVVERFHTHFDSLCCGCFGNSFLLFSF